MIDKYNVAIIGGGPAGLSCALLLASAVNNNPDLKNFKCMVIDSGFSDIERAVLNNVPGVPPNTSGKELLEFTKKQVLEFDCVNFTNGTVKEINKSNDFQIKYFEKEEKDYKIINSDIIVFATGFRSFNIKGIDLPFSNFKRSSKNSRVMLDNNDYQIAENIYVCGLAAGISSQWSIATGSGTQVGVHIISKISKSWQVIHDKLTE